VAGLGFEEMVLVVVEVVLLLEEEVLLLEEVVVAVLVAVAVAVACHDLSQHVIEVITCLSSHRVSLPLLALLLFLRHSERKGVAVSTCRDSSACIDTGVHFERGIYDKVIKREGPGRFTGQVNLHFSNRQEADIGLLA
jgi:hypothetical protein